jgi:protein-S-isoprenylcysteine O-methyltransferase Ste14
MSVSVMWHVLFWGWFASEVYIAVTTRTQRGGGSVRDRGSQIILWVVIFAAITSCEWIRHVYPQNMFGGASWLKPVGLIVLVAGITVRWTAIRTLGKAFSANVAIKESQKICKIGLYRFLRHPSYLGLLLIFLAIGLHSRNWTSFAVILVPTTAAMLYRIHIEERVLRDAFGEEYVDYVRGTKRLIPGVY